MRLATFHIEQSETAVALRDWLNEYDPGLLANVRYDKKRATIWIVDGIVGKERRQKASAICRFAEDAARGTGLFTIKANA